MTPDEGLTPRELAAVRAALAGEANPNHLFGFAGALAPDHCVSASLLHARGTLLEQRRQLDPAVLQTMLAMLTSLAYAPPAATDPSTLLRLRAQIDALARMHRLDPRPIYRGVRAAAEDLVLNGGGALVDLPRPAAQLAQLIVVQLGPVRFVQPSAVRLALPPTAALASADEHASRARWVRQYEQEAHLYERFGVVR